MPSDLIRNAMWNFTDEHKEKCYLVHAISLENIYQYKLPKSQMNSKHSEEVSVKSLNINVILKSIAESNFTQDKTKNMVCYWCLNFKNVK